MLPVPRTSDGPTIPLPVERIHVEVTNRCNFDCEFCPQGDLLRESGDMPFDLFRKVADQLEGGRIARELHFHVMGEPLLYRQLPEAVAHAEGRSVATVVTTNGSLLDRARTGALLEAGLTRLIVSLQTPDEESFKIRGAQGLSFERYEAGIRDALRHALAAGARTEVVLALRTTAYPRMQGIPALRTISSNDQLRRHVARWIADVLGEVPPRVAELLPRVSVNRWNVVRVTPRFVVESRPLGGWVKDDDKPFHPARFGTCHALAEMFAVQAGGEMTFCCMDSEGGTAVGNARTMPLADFFHHPDVLAAYRGFQRFRVVNPTCQACIGEPGLVRSLGHQLGSIFYVKYARHRFRQVLA